MKSSNRIDIVRDIKKGIEEKRYEDCIHLFVGEPGPYSSGGYFTACHKNAFEERYPDGSIGVLAPIISCPKDCDLFEDKEQAKHIQKKKIRRTQISRLLSNALREFKELIKLLTDLIRAFWGR